MMTMNFLSLRRSGLAQPGVFNSKIRQFARLFTTTRMPLVERLLQYKDRDAVVNRDGSFYTYRDVLSQCESIGEELKRQVPDLPGARIGVLCEPGKDFVAAQLAAWRVGACAVPLCISHPKAEMEYVLDNSGASAIVVDSNFTDVASSLSSRAKIISAEQNQQPDNFVDAEWNPSSPAMIIFTSGTTGKPKGVVTTHLSLDKQVTDQIETWGWQSSDRVLNCLPLHHVHGLVNMVAVPLYCGACVEFMEFDPQRVWKRFVMGPIVGGELTVFMAVPTIYAKLIHAYDEMRQADQEKASLASKKLRLMVSGSAALPTTVMMRWQEITGHLLLERWGMTELAMGLSNPLDMSKRVPGCVGLPMPSCKVKLISEETGEVIDPQSGDPGELRVSGDIVFKEYWKNPEATKSEFDEDGWFKTGDIAAFDPAVNSYRILGRASADIIKTGGFKISALEIERVLLEHADIAEIAVLGVPDEEYGEVVAAIVVMKGSTTFKEAEFKTWAKGKMAKYKVPTRYLILDEIPKNAMGKVTKKQLRKDLF